MKKLYAPSTVNEIRNRHDFKNTKSLGQNFLTDKGIIDKIVDGAGVCEDDLVLEIGPGLGVITWEAAQKAGKVIDVEIDKTLIPSAQNAELKALLVNSRPAFVGHLEHARQIQAKLAK